MVYVKGHYRKVGRRKVWVKPHRRFTQRSRIVYMVSGAYGSKRRFLRKRDAEKYVKGTNRIMYKKREFY